MVVCALRIKDSHGIEVFILKVLACTSSGGEPNFPGGHPEKSEPVGHG